MASAARRLVPIDTVTSSLSFSLYRYSAVHLSASSVMPSVAGRRCPCWSIWRGAEWRTSLALDRAGRESGRYVALRDHQQRSGRHERDDAIGHHRAPVGLIVAQEGVNPERYGLEARAVQGREGEDKIAPAGQECENRDRDDGGPGERDHDDAERTPLRGAVDPRRVHQLVGQTEQESPQDENAERDGVSAIAEDHSWQCAPKRRLQQAGEQRRGQNDGWNDLSEEQRSDLRMPNGTA